MNDLAVWTDDGALIALRRRRSLRVGLTQALTAVAGVALGLVVPSISSGPQIDVAGIQPLLVALGGGLVSFIALVFSLLFLVVQYGSTTFTPRLTLFRDDPLVWRTFAAFVGVFLFVTTATLQMANLRRVTLAVPVLAVAFVVMSLMLARRLQMRALGMVQLNATLEEVRGRGERVLRKLYFHDHHRPVETDSLPEQVQVVRWERAHSVLRQLDLPALHAAAVAADATIVVHARVGQELRRASTVFAVHGRSTIDEAVLRAAIDNGIDRTFQQDPLLAFRLLTDIGVRALSPAINDPATAVSAIGQIDDLLSLVATRELDVGRVGDQHGVLRVALAMPSWPDFLEAAIDDLAHYGAEVPAVQRRIAALLDDLAESCRPDRVDAVAARRRTLESSRTLVTSSPTPRPGGRP